MEYEIYKEKETFYEDYHGKILDRKQLKEAVCKWCPATASVAEQNGRDAELSGHLFL